MTARRLIVRGRVQGVFFRGWTADEARALGLSGWVRNRRDGTVEMVVDGPEDAIAAMVESVHRGPPAARVERVEVADADEAPPRGFEQRPTV